MNIDHGMIAIDKARKKVEVAYAIYLNPPEDCTTDTLALLKEAYLSSFDALVMTVEKVKARQVDRLLEKNHLSSIDELESYTIEQEREIDRLTHALRSCQDSYKAKNPEPINVTDI